MFLTKVSPDEISSVDVAIYTKTTAIYSNADVHLTELSSTGGGGGSWII